MDYGVIAIVLLAIGAGFFVRAVTGFAAALVALPILLLVLPVRQAVGLLAIFFFVFSIVMIVQHRHMIKKRMVMKIGAAILVGTLTGLFFLKFLSSAILLKLLGVFILCYVVYRQFFGKAQLLRQAGPVLGFAGGVFSAIFASGGSLYVTYLHNRFSDADLLRANAIGLLGLADILRMPLFVQQGIVTWQTLQTALLVLPVFVLALYFGNKIHAKIDSKIFENVVTGILLVSAVALII